MRICAAHTSRTFASPDAQFGKNGHNIGIMLADVGQYTEQLSTRARSETLQAQETWRRPQLTHWIPRDQYHPVRPQACPQVFTAPRWFTIIPIQTLRPQADLPLLSPHVASLPHSINAHHAHRPLFPATPPSHAQTSSHLPSESTRDTSSPLPRKKYTSHPHSVSIASLSIQINCRRCHLQNMRSSQVPLPRCQTCSMRKRNMSSMQWNKTRSRVSSAPKRLGISHPLVPSYGSALDFWSSGPGWPLHSLSYFWMSSPSRRDSS